MRIPTMSVTFTYDERGLLETEGISFNTGSVAPNKSFTISRVYDDNGNLTHRVARPPLAVGLRSNKTFAPCGFHHYWKFKRN